MVPLEPISTRPRRLLSVTAGQGGYPPREDTDPDDRDRIITAAPSHSAAWHSERDQLRRRLLRMILRNELERRHLSA